MQMVHTSNRPARSHKSAMANTCTMLFKPYFRGMFAFTRFAAFVTFALLALSLRAQGLYENKFYGPYLLLYKLNPQQAEFVVRHPEKIDSQFLYTYLAGKVHTDSIIPLWKRPVDDYPIKPFWNYDRFNKCGPLFHVWDIRDNGYFIEVNVNSLGSVHYKVIENPLFNVGVHRIGYETFIFVEDTAGLPVYNATVHLDTAFCPYDSSVGGYRIQGKNIFGLIKVERNGIFTLTHLNGYQDKQNNTRPPADHYDYAKIRCQGYLVTNKPRYKHWDTLFFKAFLVNMKGKPLKKTLIAQLSQSYGGYTKSMTLKPTDKGAYNGYFIVNDSFVLDQQITLSLNDIKNNVLKSQTVFVENYELKDLSFTLRADKDLVTPGGGIKLYASANTINRLPVMDGKLTLKLKLININYTDGDSVVIPYAKMENWYTVNVQTDPSGVTIFDLPDSIFIPLSGQYLATCRLLTSDNELREATVYFNYQTTRDRQEAALNGDTLHVERLYNMKSVRRTMRIKIFSRKDILVDSVFHTPLNLYLPPNVYMVQIFRGDTLSGTFYRQTQLPEVWGKRTHDSVNIYFTSQKDIPVFYRIYANNQLVAKGKTTKLAWHAKDKSKNSYHIQYGILEGSVTQPRFYSMSFHLAEKELKVEIIQPETVYPGQEVAIEIRIKDAYGKPVNKVNLAAWAVNTQMDGIVTPDVPYMGLVKPQKALPTYSWPLYPIEKEFNGALMPWQVNAFMLRKNAIFKLAYPENGFTVLTDTTPRHSTEIDFYAHGSGQRQNIVYVKANDTLLWYNPGTPLPGTIRIKPGKYNFTIRTYNKIFKFNNVEITAGKKNFVCLHIDSLNQLKKGDTMREGILRPDENKMLMGHTLLFRFDQMVYDTLLFKVNGELKYAAQSGGIYNFKTINIVSKIFNPTGNTHNKYKTTQTFYQWGPVNDGDRIEVAWKNGYSHEFVFESGTSYSFTKNDLVRDTIPQWGTMYIGQAYNTGGYTFYSFWWDPFYRDTTHHNPDQPVYPMQNPYREVLQEFQYNNYSPYNKKGVYNSQLHLYINQYHTPQKMWLFNTQDSSFSILENYNAFGNNYYDIGMISRRYLQLFSPQKMTQHFRLVLEINDTSWLVKNITIDSSVHLYLTLNISQLRKLGKSEYILYDRMAKNLAREALTQWVDTPTINTGLFVIPLKHINGGTSIEGTVIGPNIKYPVNNAFIVLEKNGIFVRGAISNREGRFVMDNLQPGIYMLKIKGDKYHYWIHYQLEIKAGFNHLVQAQMKQYAWMSYEAVAYDADGDAVKDYTNENESSAGAGASMNYYATPSVRGFVNVESGKKAKMRLYDKMANKPSAVTVTTTDYAKGEYAESTFEFGNSMADTTYSLGWNGADQNRERDRLGQMATDPNAQRIRKDFRDYAYWIPNLYTNKKGMAGYTIKYPDNVTSWRTFVPAMDGKRHSGLGELTVRSYKPLIASLAIPLFLTEGDTLQAYSRIVNYTGQSLQGKYTFKYNQFSNTKELTVKDFFTDNLQVLGTKPGDTLSVETLFELANGYRDGELRKIIVNAANVIAGKSSFAQIASDTTMVFKADSNDLGMEVSVYNEKLALIMDMLAQVENLPAYDNRSLAAYLNALLIKKSICGILKIPFTQEKQIRETMSKLKKAQDDNGFFGWFKNSRSSFMVSTYVANAMFKAHKMGYENNTWLNAAHAMEKNMPHVWGYTRLAYLLSLKNMGRTLDYDSFIKGLNPKQMNRSQKLDYVRLQQLLGKPIPVEEVAALMEPTYEGNLKVSGDWVWEFAPITDDAANTYKTWQILFDANYDKERREAMVDYLSTECESHSNSWIKAAECMLAEALKDSSVNRTMQPEIYANGIQVAPKDMPKIFRLKPGETLILKHKGAPVFVATNRKYKTYSPVSDPRQFRMEISIPAAKDNKLVPGVPVDMKVTVFAARNQYNTIVEIPIPAGCVFGPKIYAENWDESHREYLSDRVLIFHDEMSFGYHTFTIRLIPKFNGVFYTAPSRTALMFYSDKAAYTSKTRYSISK